MATEEPAPDQPASASSAGFTARRKSAIAVAAVTAVVGVAVAVAALTGAPGSPEPVSTRASGGPSSNSAPEATDAASPSGSPSASAPPSGSASPGTPGDPAVPAAPVPIEQPATINRGVTAEVSKLEAVDGEARTPGEVSAPSVRVTVSITNATSADVSLATTIVTAYFGAEQTPALELGEPGSSPMPATAGPGQTVTGVYVFSIPAGERQNVRIMVDYSVDIPPLVFEGAAPA